ncbi:response regulator transcription factor [Telmatospirillum sp.]|uniref:response regulator transcription factor n=1 Tax=Telmatospirillum sp. TaxID=2079197 RepID=UPI0028522CE9|nr:response regulator transcription factor [Telmatospirillum sp.]MDR3438654.1 response regulator transcription factor [Telmatospirillum sp.]
MTTDDVSRTGRAIHILVVEDDHEINALITRFLRKSNYIAVGVGNGREMDAAMAGQVFDLVLLDLLLPEENGLDLCRRIRATSDACIIMVTALAEVTDRVAGLELGADDYVSKPFELVELGARIRAVLRRGQPSGVVAPPPAPAPAPAGGLRFAGWRFEPERRLLYTESGVRMALTGAETDLMLVFYRHAGQVVTRRQLIALTRGDEDAIDERAIDLLVSRLRRKLAQGGRQLELIRTVRGDGYLFDSDIPAADGGRS